MTSSIDLYGGRGNTLVFGTKGEERKVSVCGSGWKVRVTAFVVETWRGKL